MLLISLGAVVVALYLIGAASGVDVLLPAPETRGTLAAGLLGLVLLFCLYMFHQQHVLRRMSEQLVAARLAEESLRARLTGAASLFSAVAEVGMEVDLEGALATLADNVTIALRADRAEIHLAPTDSPAGEETAPGPPAAGNGRARPAFLSVPLVAGAVTIGRLDVHRADKASCFTDEDRGVLAAFASNVAVTIQNIRHKHRQAHVQQAVKLEAVGRLAGGVAHDFNNLLTTIRGRGELMLRRLAPDDPARRNAEEVVRAADRAATLTRQLLSFANDRMPSPSTANLNDVAGTRAVLDQLSRPISATPGGTSTEAHPGRETVLVVEDEDDVRALTCEVLADHGYDVLKARNGSEAVLLARRHRGPIHLILADVVMPGMSGCEVVDRLRTTHPEVNVLYMSGYAVDVLRQHGDQVVGDALLQKPFSPDDLVDRVRRSLGPRSDGRSAAAA